MTKDMGNGISKIDILSIEIQMHFLVNTTANLKDEQQKYWGKGSLSFSEFF